MIDAEMLRPTADEMLSGLTAGDAMRNRLRFQAEAVDKLPEIAAEMLGGLRATPALRHRILLAAARKQEALVVSIRPTPSQRRPALLRYLPAASMALVLTVMIGLGLNYGRQPSPVPGTAGINSGMSTYQAGQTAATGTPEYRPLFAGTNAANPPLICVNGRYYRMLTTPAPLPDTLRGTTMAQVQTFTDEPSLAGSVGVVSNVAQVGATVYAVDGLSQKTACAAEVDGVLRLFQRVGYASETIVGNEMFEDTLDVGGQVAMLELSGVGVIRNEAYANELIYMLSEFAVYHSSEIAEGDTALTIYLKNGLSLQLLVQDDVLGGCGAWACPEFFDYFDELLLKQESEAAKTSELPEEMPAA